MAKVSDVRVAGGTAELGTFKVRMFNLFDDDDIVEYEQLRTRNNDRSTGVKIENIQQVSRKTVIASGAGEDMTTTTTEDIHMLVQWWEKNIVRDKGDSDEELDARRVWAHEKTAGNY